MPITVEDARKFHKENADEMQSANPSGKAPMMQDEEEDAKKKKRRRMFIIAGAVIILGIAAYLFLGKKKGGSTLNGSESPNIS